MKNIHILLFYKYVDLTKLNQLKKRILGSMERLNLKGRILLAKEGINGSVSGTKEEVDYFKKELSGIKKFNDIVFKEDIDTFHPFKKTQVKIKKTIANFGDIKVDLKNTGTRLSPKEFLEMANQEETIILDARNDYESKVGRFKGAHLPNINKFSEFRKVLEELKGKEDKPILTYCTGGVRCEKASAFLKENGFKNVYQLEGGIVTFGKELPDTIWEGVCYVFDKRMLSPINTKASPITECSFCGTKSGKYRNCQVCNRYYITCQGCRHNHDECCSEKCATIKNQTPAQ